ncbi:MAG: tail fiber domain-containing protein [Flavobacteriales bacterium]|nr:tail fiber domain-containing protein [Flavobacteriales bacterium]
MKTLTRIILAFVLLNASMSLQAQNTAPLQKVKMSVQGILKNLDGTIVIDGTYRIEFRIYDGSTSVDELWMELDDAVTVSGGVYNTYLGSTPAGLQSLNELDYNTIYYVGITVVGSVEMTPRMELTGSPFAIRARMSDHATTAGRADTATLADHATTAGHATTAATATEALSLVSGAATTPRWAVDVGIKSDDNQTRMMFQTNSNTIFGTGDGHIFQNQAGNNILTLNSVGGLGLTNNVHHNSLDGVKRFWFNANGASYFLSPDGYRFRNPADDADIFTIANNGALTVASDVHHLSSDGVKRFWFNANGASYFLSPDGYRFRNPADDADIFTIDDAGSIVAAGSLNSDNHGSFMNQHGDHQLTIGGLSNGVNSIIYSDGDGNLRLYGKGGWVNSDGNHHILGSLLVDGNLNLSSSGAWITDSQDNERIHFSDNGPTYLQSPGGYIFRNAAMGHLFEIENNGNVHASGNITSSTMTITSDRRFKTDISPLTNSLNNVLQLQGVTYNWNQKDFPERNFSDDQQIGVIAQELEKVYPEFVRTDAEGYKTVNYSQLTAVLIEAIKELNNKVENQQTEIDNLQSEKAELKSDVLNNAARLLILEEYLQVLSSK